MWKYVLAGCLAVAVLGGCANANWKEGIRPWWQLSAKEFAAIPKEMTKADVERAVGKPLLAETFARLGEDVWDYRFLDGTKKYGAEVHFNLDGKVTYVVTFEDSCPSAPVACH